MIDADFDTALAAALERRLKGGTAAVPIRPSGSDTRKSTPPPTQLRNAA